MTIEYLSKFFLKLPLCEFALSFTLLFTIQMDVKRFLDQTNNHLNIAYYVVIHYHYKIWYLYEIGKNGKFYGSLRFFNFIQFHATFCKRGGPFQNSLRWKIWAKSRWFIFQVFCITIVLTRSILNASNCMTKNDFFSWRGDFLPSQLKVALFSIKASTWPK